MTLEQTTSVQAALVIAAVVPAALLAMILVINRAWRQAEGGGRAAHPVPTGAMPPSPTPARAPWAGLPDGAPPPAVPASAVGVLQPGTTRRAA